MVRCWWITVLNVSVSVEFKVTLHEQVRCRGNLVLLQFPKPKPTLKLRFSESVHNWGFPSKLTVTDRRSPVAEAIYWARQAFWSLWATAISGVPIFSSVTHTHTHTHLTALFLGLPGWAGTKKVKLIWILVKQETVSGSGISWAICKSISLQTDNHASTPPLKFFTGRLPFLSPNQQRQSTEGTN